MAQQYKMAMRQSRTEERIQWHSCLLTQWHHDRGLRTRGHGSDVTQWKCDNTVKKHYYSHPVTQCHDEKWHDDNIMGLNKITKGITWRIPVPAAWFSLCISYWLSPPPCLSSPTHGSALPSTCTGTEKDRCTMRQRESERGRMKVQRREKRETESQKEIGVWT